MSDIPYRAFPISLEKNPLWLSLSLKRRALFQFLIAEAVGKELHTFKGINLTYGEYAWTYQTLAERFNETVCPDDHFSKTGVHKAIESFIEIGFVEVLKIGSGVRSLTIIKITHADTYALIKKQRCTINDAWRTNGERSEDDHGERSENVEKPSDNIPEEGKEDLGNDGGERKEKVVNRGVVNDQQDLTRSNTKDNVLEDNVRTVVSKKSFDNGKDGVDASRKFKLRGEEIECYEWLKSKKIDSSDGTLSFWAKNYSLKRLKQVYEAADKTKPKKDGTKSIGALMTTFLREQTIFAKDYRSENTEFMEGYKDQIPEMQWEIEKKYATCIVHGIRKEILLNIDPRAFVDQLLILENQFKGG